MGAVKIHLVDVMVEVYTFYSENFCVLVNKHS